MLVVQQADGGRCLMEEVGESLQMEAISAAIQVLIALRGL